MNIADVVAERVHETRAVLANLSGYYEALVDLEADVEPNSELRYECARFLSVARKLDDARTYRRLAAQADPVGPVMSLVRELLSECGASIDPPAIGAALEINGWEPPAGLPDRLELIEAACARLAEQPNSPVRRTHSGEYVYSRAGTPLPERPAARVKVSVSV
ncbi:hypothetical protein [Nocardia sp. NPDC005978]|uniref:hypothetical protein n=1 Tax=unclassified Nocardia TaxID=2637762 RepID=UPI0033B04C04